MKKVILISLAISLSYIKASAQTQGVPDTLAYLQTIIANKAQYIGQPFSTLLNNLQIQIKHFWPNANLSYDKTKETATQFAYYFPLSQEEIYLTYPCLEIYWQTPLNITQSNIIRATNNNRGQWNSEAALFYANGIIKDIQIRD